MIDNGLNSFSHCVYVAQQFCMLALDYKIKRLINILHTFQII